MCGVDGVPQFLLFSNQTFCKNSMLQASEKFLIESSKIQILIFFTKEIEFFVNIGPYGSANFEMPLLLQL